MKDSEDPYKKSIFEDIQKIKKLLNERFERYYSVIPSNINQPKIAVLKVIACLNWSCLDYLVEKEHVCIIVKLLEVWHRHQRADNDPKLE